MGYENFHVLLIDDSDVTCKLFELVFEHFSAPLSVVADAESALNYLEHTTPELIVVDLYLNGTDGWATLHHLRGMGFRGPIVATTYFHDSKVWSRAFIAGFDGYLAKPIAVRTLVPYLYELWTGYMIQD